MERFTDITSRRQAAFFESEGQELYDSVIGNLVPFHSEMLCVLKTVLKAYCNRNSNRTSPIAVLDIGSGTGSEALWIAREFSETTIMAIDNSVRMNTIFKQKLAALDEPDASLVSRITLLHDDYLYPQLDSPLTEKREAFDVVFSIYAFHHFRHDEKSEGYRRAFELLKPGGILILADLFGYESQPMATLALDFDLKHIENCFETLQKRETNPERKLVLNDLCQKWLEHYRKDNITESIEGKDGQLELLIKAGFQHGSCLFRYWQVGLLTAVKPIN